MYKFSVMRSVKGACNVERATYAEARCAHLTLLLLLLLLLNASAPNCTVRCCI